MVQAHFVRSLSAPRKPTEKRAHRTALPPLERVPPAVQKGRSLQLPLYRYLAEPLTRRFGAAWYEELCAVAEQLLAE